jgi:hypothetical protein
MALYETTLALLRPIPGHDEAPNDPAVPDMPRKFLPNISEFIVELREQDERWRCRAARVLELPAKHAEALRLKAARGPDYWERIEAEKAAEAEAAAREKVMYPEDWMDPDEAQV